MNQTTHGHRTVRLVVSGAVQGVGYRQWMKREARQFGLVGWVKNSPDGSVEALISGDEDAVQSLIRQASRGPMLARVTAVQSYDAKDFSSKEFIVIQ